jgi:hypothetical protein
MPGDTDSDGLPDWFEVALNFNPNQANGTADQDADTLTDYTEYLAGTFPYNGVSNGVTPDQLVDSDGDGRTNLQEQLDGTHPGVPTVGGSDVSDLDDDGLSDTTELASHTQPGNSLSPWTSRALRLGETGDYLLLPNQPRFSLPDDWSIDAWVKLAPTDADGGVVIARATDADLNGTFETVNYELGVKLIGGALRPYVRFVSARDDLGNGGVVIQVPTDATAGNVPVMEASIWTHIAGVYSATDATLSIVVNNGFPFTVASGTVLPGADTTGVTRVTVGNGLLGEIDAVRIWSLAKTDFSDNDTATVAEALAPVAGAPVYLGATGDPRQVGRTGLRELAGITAQDAALPLDGPYRLETAAAIPDAGLAAIPAGLVATYIFDDDGLSAQDFAVDRDDWRTEWFNAALVVDTGANGTAGMVDAPASPVQPVETDGDGDGMPDWWETENGQWTFFDDSQFDDDGDGLWSIYEYWAGTDPFNPDTDGDGTPDTHEDYDRDGLTNLEEQQYRTRPDLNDTDDDGADDLTEVIAVTSPTHPMSVPNPDNSNMATPRSLAMRHGESIGIMLPFSNRFAFGYDEWTVEAWVFPGTQDRTGDLLRFEGDNRVGYRLSLVDGVPEGVVFRRQNDGSETRLVSVGGVGATAPLPTTRWSHLAIAWDPAANALRLYRDGILMLAQQTLADPSVGTSGRAFLARHFNDGVTSDVGSGFVDEVRVWAHVRTDDEIEYWRTHLFPTLETIDLDDYEYGDVLRAYYRFDDGGQTVEDFAHLSDPAYFLRVPVTAETAARVRGIDDADGDGLAEWWVALHQMNEWPDFYFEPTFIYNSDGDIDGVAFMRSFTAYTSIGNGNSSWLENLQYRTTKSDVLEEDGRYARVVKYVRLTQVPQQATLRLWAFGISLDELYVNGVAVAPAATVDITPYLVQGRNQIAVFFERTTSYVRTINYFNSVDGNAATFDQDIYVGKFDADLDVDGQMVIVRGDDTRFDPRAVWHGVTASTWIFDNNIMWTEDLLARELPHLDYGVPRDPDDDGLENFYEQALMTNPRDADSDNDAVPDSDEDFDADGLTNAQEFTLLSDPLRIDSDDDGLIDGAEVRNGTSPVESLSPLLDRVLDLSAAGSFVEMPIQRRFALGSWTIQAYVRSAAASVTAIDGVVLRRSVGAAASGKHYVTWELRLDDGVPVARVTSASLSADWEVSKPGAPILRDTWTHLAATYDAATTSLRLYRDGQLIAARIIGTTCALNGPGPISTTVGAEGADGFRGEIDDVRAFGTVLTRDEIEAGRYAELLGNETGLVAYYRFDDGTYTGPDGILDGDRGELIAGHVQDFAILMRDWQNDWENAGTLVHGAVMRQVAPTEAYPFSTERWTDSDGDHMADWWELQFFGDLANDGTADWDDDFLTDLAEYHAGTNPTAFDSDGDGLPDSEEDPDADGLWNYEEDVYQTHPLMADTDDDGLGDSDELFVFATDPADSLQPVVPRVLRLTGSESMTVHDSADTAQSQFTLAVWVKPAVSAAAQGILRRAERTDSHANYRLILTASNSIEFSYDMPVTGRTIRVTSGAVVPDNQWSLVIGRLNTSTAGGAARRLDVTVFVLESGAYRRYTTTGTALGSAVVDTRGDLVVGFAEHTGDNPMKRVECERFMGDLDEIGLWARLLTDLELTALTQAAPVPGNVDETADGVDSDGDGAVDDIVGPYATPEADTTNGTDDDGDGVIDDDATMPEGLPEFDVPSDVVAYFKFDDGGLTGEDFAHSADWYQNWRHAGRFNPDNRIVVNGQVVSIDEPDRLPDAWELEHFGSLGISQGLEGQDFDSDGLSDWYEYLAGTDPTVADTDGNGVADINEDLDGDGLSNGFEQGITRTHPRRVDTDDDGVRDQVESNARTDAANSLDPFRSRAAVFAGPGRFVVANQTRHELATWTVEASIRPPSATTSGILVRRALAPASPADVVNFELGLTAGRPYVRFTDETGVSREAVDSAALAAGTWHHLSATLGGGSLKLYVTTASGTTELESVAVATACRTRGATGYQEISFGAGYPVAGAFASALPVGTRLDEVRLWSRALTQTEIAAAAAGPVNVAASTALVGYWRFDDGLGVDSHSIEDFTAPLANVDGLADWCFNWPHAAYPAGEVVVDDRDAPADTDRDSLPDWWEMAVFDNLLQTPSGDPDGDLLTNLDEYLGTDGVGQTESLTGVPAWGIGDGTNPADPDTDGDLLPDGSEVRTYRTKPYAADSDDDSIDDRTELYSGTLPNYALDPYKTRSVRFDGAPGSLLRAAARADLSLTKFTVEFWFKRSTVVQTGEQVLLSRRAGAAVNFEIGIDEDYLPFGRFTFGGGAGPVTVTSPASVQDAALWHHIALVYDPEITGELRLYVDGIRRAIAATWLVPDLAMADLTIGSNGTSGFAGWIDELRVWRVARTTAQVTGDMRRQLSGSESDLVSYFIMDDDEWAGSAKSPAKYGAQDFVTNRLGDSAIGQGGYAFSTEVPTLLPGDRDNDGLPDAWEIANGLSPTDATGDNGAAGDPDNDGLTNLGEYEAGTRARNPDTDGDGMADGWEVINGLDALALDNGLDPDGDGLSNMEEYLGADLLVDLVAVPPDWGDATDPLDSDTDDDGLPDGWERLYRLDATDDTGDNGATGDPDNDGLTNAEERDYLTDPRDADSDGDGLPDGWEVANGLSPVSAVGRNGALGDPDADGATNIVEYGQGTDPRNRDTDGDSLPDGWEIRYDLNPLSDVTPNGRNDDPDLDNRTNYEEYLAGTNPKVPEDEATDSDGDGLTDMQEWQPGVNTDPHLPDTDDDGVGDREEYIVGTEGYNSLSKESINTFVDLSRYNRLDYRGNLIARLDEAEYLEVPGVAADGQRLAFSSWTVEARFRFRFGPDRGEIDAAALDTGDELYLVRRAFEEVAPSGQADTNYAIGLKVGTSGGRTILYPFTRWYNTVDEAPERVALRTASVPNLELAVDQWYHLAGRYDAAAHTLTLFLDGVPVAEQTDVAGYCPTDLPNQTPFVRIGENFAGDLDEVRVWGVPPRALRYTDLTTGQDYDLNGTVLSDEQIALNAARSVVPTYGTYDGALSDLYTLVNPNAAAYVVDRHVTQMPWTTLSGTAGRLVTGLFYEDANLSGVWEDGETVWQDVASVPDPADPTTLLLGIAGAYDVGVDVLIHSLTPPAAAIAGPTVRPLAMYYNDVSGDRVWQPTEDAWVDYANTASWYEAQASPWAQAMGLALYLKFDDAGETIEDYAWHADWRAFWVHAIRPQTTGLTMADVVQDGNAAPTAPRLYIDPATTDKRVALDALLRVRISLAASDPDGLRVQYRYAWFLGTGKPADSTAPILFVDTSGDGLWDAGEVIYSDTNRNGVLNAGEQLVGAADSLGSAVTLDLEALGAAANQYYYAVVVPVDELGKEGPFAIDYVLTATRTAPARPEFLGLSPDLAQPGDPLALALRNVSGRRVSIVVDWYRNGEHFLTAQPVELPAIDNPDTDEVIETDTVITLDGNLTRRGDLWSFMAYARDENGGLSRPTYGTGDDPQARVTRVIGGGAGSVAQNLPPSAPTEVAITPELPLDEDMLICSVSGSVDAEGDAFAYIFQWYQFDDTLEAYVLAGVTDPVVDEALTAAGERWFCQVYAVDVFGNRSVAISSNPVIIGTAPAGALAFEPNDTYNQARRILPKVDPTDVGDASVQEHQFASRSDRDWVWFLVEDGPGYETVRVTLETNDGAAMWTPYHSALNDGVDTILALYRASANGAPRFIRQVDDVGVIGQPGGSRYARLEIDLDPGIYYAQFWTNMELLPEAATYSVHLWFQVPPGASGPSAPTTALLRPAEPTASDDIVCEAGGAVSPLGEGHLRYLYVWFRDGQVVPFGAGAQPYEGTNYILANAKPAVSADGSAANVVPAEYTREGEVWTCMVFAADDNGESEYLVSNAVTIATVAWQQLITVDKTYSDGTAAQSQVVTLGWRFGATHGFDVGMDIDLPAGPPEGPGGTTLAGSSYSLGLEPEHTRLTSDLRPFGETTSWYLRVELGANPASCSLTWDELSLPLAETPLTITRVEQGPYGEFYPVYGSTVDMSLVDGIAITPAEIAALAAGTPEGEAVAVMYRISLGAGDGSQTLHLTYGWNMISFSIQPITPAATSVFAFNGQQVIAGIPWAYVDGAYVPVTEVEAKVGYWVFCPFPGGATFTVHGLPASGNLTLDVGWNLVGPVVATDLHDAYAAYGKGVGGSGAVDLDNVMTLNPATMDYEIVDTMVPGRAYWVHASRAVELPVPLLSH